MKEMKPLDFSEIPAEWQQARVRYSRQQGTGHIIEIEFLESSLKGRRTEARRIGVQSRKSKRAKLMKSRRWRKKRKIDCTACGKKSCTGHHFCRSCAGKMTWRMRCLGETQAEAAFAVMVEVQEENDGNTIRAD